MLKQVLIVGALLAASSTAYSQSRHHRGDSFARADANGDGMVVRDEFLAARAGMFARMDRNSDGFIDAADREQRESQRPHGGRGAKRIARMDADGDGKLSKDEFVNGAAAAFDRVDADRNSVLDAKEIEAAKSRARERPDRDAP